MEVFRAASAQMQNAASTEVQHHTDARAVEKTNNQQKVASKDDQQNVEQFSQDQLDMALEQLNDNMKSLETNIRFAFSDKPSGMFIKVVRADNGEVIREFPSEQVRRLTENFREIVGMLFDKKE